VYFKASLGKSAIYFLTASLDDVAQQVPSIPRPPGPRPLQLSKPSCTPVPIERVSVLLGHSGIMVTEKHYSSWVRARQEQLEAGVRRAWASEISRRVKGDVSARFEVQ
jgi:hypothetical protein